MIAIDVSDRLLVLAGLRKVAEEKARKVASSQSERDGTAPTLLQYMDAVVAPLLRETTPQSPP